MLNTKRVIVLVFVLFLYQVFCNENLLSKFHQSDYDLKGLMVDVSYVNDSMASEFRVASHKYNRTTEVLNFTLRFNVDIGYKLEVIVQTFKRYSNEYRLFPIRFQINGCIAMNANIAGLRSLENENFPLCNWKKGRYYTSYNFLPDHSRLPPYIPVGEYKSKMEFFYFKAKISTLNVYEEVFIPAGLEN